MGTPRDVKQAGDAEARSNPGRRGFEAVHSIFGAWERKHTLDPFSSTSI